MSLAEEGFKSGTLEYQREWHRRNKDRYKEVRRQWYEANKDKVNTDSKARYTAKQFGLTVEEYDTIRASTSNCECCLTQLSLRERRLDHCHTTGKIRGILCNSCNTGIGMFKDSTELLKSAIDYLEKNGSSN